MCRHIVQAERARWRKGGALNSAPAVHLLQRQMTAYVLAVFICSLSRTKLKTAPKIASLRPLIFAELGSFMIVFP